MMVRRWCYAIIPPFSDKSITFVSTYWETVFRFLAYTVGLVLQKIQTPKLMICEQSLIDLRSNSVLLGLMYEVMVLYPK